MSDPRFLEVVQHPDYYAIYDVKLVVVYLDQDGEERFATFIPERTLLDAEVEYNDTYRSYTFEAEPVERSEKLHFRVEMHHRTGEVEHVMVAEPSDIGDGYGDEMPAIRWGLDDPQEVMACD